MTVSQIPWPLFQAAGSHHCNVFVRMPSLSERRLGETWVSSVAAANGNNRYLMWESQATHYYTEWQHAVSLKVTRSGTFNCYQTLYGYITVLQRRRVKNISCTKGIFLYKISHQPMTVIPNRGLDATITSVLLSYTSKCSSEYFKGFFFIFLSKQDTKVSRQKITVSCTWRNTSN